MLCMARILLFFSRGGLAPALRAIVRAIARAFKSSSSRKQQPTGAACTPLAIFNPAKDDSHVATGVFTDELIKPDNSSNGESGDTKPGGIAVAIVHPKLSKATVTHPAEAPAVYSFLCMLDIADMRLRRALADKAKLEAEVDELRRRVKSVDDAGAELILRLESQLKESRAREKDLRSLLQAQAELTEQCNADMRHKLAVLALQYDWLLKASSAANAELRDKALRLELCVADLEADLKEAQTQPNADVAFLLSRCGDLELALEAANARLSNTIAVHHERSAVGC
jgi:hypothetical protein